MKNKLYTTDRGFTLIELLMVIAIIGILSSTVFAAIGSARARARDAKRVAELTEIRSALYLFYDINQTYPSTTPSGLSGNDAGIKLISGDVGIVSYLPKTPIPPPGGSPTYIYEAIQEDGSPCDDVDQVCSSFALGVTLERSEHSGLPFDAGQTLGTTFYGEGADCLSSAAGSEKCYDLRP